MADYYTGGHGTTIAFTSSGLVAPMRLIGGAEMTRGKIPISDLSKERMMYRPAGISDPGEFDVEFLFDIYAADYATKFPNIDYAPEITTITYPNPNLESAGATLVGKAFFVAVSYPDISSDEPLVGRGTIAWEGDDDEPVLSEFTS